MYNLRPKSSKWKKSKNQELETNEPVYETDYKSHKKRRKEKRASNIMSVGSAKNQYVLKHPSSNSSINAYNDSNNPYNDSYYDSADEYRDDSIAPIRAQLFSFDEILENDCHTKVDTILSTSLLNKSIDSHQIQKTSRNDTINEINSNDEEIPTKKHKRKKIKHNDFAEKVDDEDQDTCSVKENKKRKEIQNTQIETDKNKEVGFIRKKHKSKSIDPEVAIDAENTQTEIAQTAQDMEVGFIRKKHKSKSVNPVEATDADISLDEVNQKKHKEKKKHSIVETQHTEHGEIDNLDGDESISVGNIHKKKHKRKKKHPDSEVEHTEKMELGIQERDEDISLEDVHKKKHKRKKHSKTEPQNIDDELVIAESNKGEKKMKHLKHTDSEMVEGLSLKEQYNNYMNNSLGGVQESVNSAQDSNSAEHLPRKKLKQNHENFNNSEIYKEDGDEKHDFSENQARIKKEIRHTAIEKKPKSNMYTVSIAVPVSTLDNTLKPMLRTYITGQIARAAAVFCVDEIILYQDNQQYNNYHGQTAAEQMDTILRYMECPQYLRHRLFPLSEDLRFAGLLNPLNCPHHLRQMDYFDYREGVVVSKGKAGSLLDIGLKKMIAVKKDLPDDRRVTVKILDEGGEHMVGEATNKDPIKSLGVYWGYTVRKADSMSAVLTECPYDEGYDLSIGTSDKGTDIDTTTLPDFKHMLVVFGGVNGLESTVTEDVNLDTNDPRHLFDMYLNTCPQQGCRTIRTEEAIPITLAALRPKIHYM